VAAAARSLEMDAAELQKEIKKLGLTE